VPEAILNPQLGFVLFLFMFSFACNRFSNGIDHFEQICGETPEYSQFRYFRILDLEGNFLAREELRVSSSAAMFTSKGCLKISRSSSLPVEVSYPKKSSGITVPDNYGVSDSITDIRLIAFSYKNILSTCPVSIATQGSVLEAQADLRDQDLRGYSWDIALADEKKVLLRSKSRSPVMDAQKLSLLDIRSLPDGAYKLKMSFKQLHSVDQLESVIECQVFIDRTSPVFSLAGLKRVDASESSPSIVAPGETIRIIVDDPGTAVQVFGCLARLDGVKNPDCEFERLDDRVITAPAQGEWVLRGYAVDAAENRGPLAEKAFQVVDSNAVAAIKALSQQAEFAVSSGEGMTSILSAVQSYEKFKKLGSQEEKSAVRDDVRRALFETSVLPLDELYFALSRPEQRQSVGLTETSKGLAFVSTLTNIVTNEVSLSIAPVSGDEEYKISLKSMGTLNPTVAVCADRTILVAFGSTGMIPVVNGRAGNLVPFSGTLGYTGFGLTTDCRYAYFGLIPAGDFRPRSTTLVDVVTGQSFTVKTPLEQVYNAVGPTAVLAKAGAEFVVMNIQNGESRAVFPDLASSSIRTIQATGTGELGILTRDNVLHLFDSELKKVSQIADVEAIYPASSSKEIIAVGTGGFTVKIVNPESGRVVFQVSDTFTEISYLGADRDHLVYKNYTIDRVRVFPRNGYQAPEQIYSLNSQISNVWIADPGYLFIQNARFMKLVQLNGFGVFLKKAPEYSTAVGLAFLDNDSLIYKSQAGRVVDYPASILEGSVNVWNTKNETIQSHILPSLNTTEVLNVPTYAGYSRDVKVFKGSDGQAMVATVFGKGSLGLSELNVPGQILMQNDICRDWAFDLDIAPNGSLGAIICAEGSVKIFDLKTLSVVSSFDIKNGMPINVGFDSSSQYLFVTDSSQGLQKLSYDALSKTLNEDSFIPSAGMRLAMSPKRDSLAVLGSNSELRIFNLDLGLQGAPISTNSQFSVMATSLAYDRSGTVIYAGLYDGTVTEVDLKTARTLKIRFNAADDGSRALQISPDGQKLAFYGKGKVQVLELDVEKRYKNICRWLKPRLRYFSSLPGYAAGLCN
jgi:WD40 repeat protein